MSAAPSASEVESFRARRDAVLDRIAAAASRSGRAPGDVTLVAVSKTVPAERLASAVDAGLTLLGENRVQEAASKAPLLLGVRWHLVGRLQSNKARHALGLFSALEAVDSVPLALRLDRIAGELIAAGVAVPWSGRVPVYLETNVDDDPAKGGFAPADLEAALPELLALQHLEPAGLMTVGRLVDRAELARPTFVRLRELSERLRARDPRLGPGLSMGMSVDFEVAVEEGATIVRVGTALFGERPRHDHEGHAHEGHDHTH